jgi:predicted SAM-dependent methyltransferase
MTLPARINIGSDVFLVPGLVNIDIRREVHPNVVMAITELGLRSGIASEITLGNILEHLPPESISPALSECKRVLEDSGVLYITIPLVDVAEECHARGEISQETLQHIIKGDPAGYNSHKMEYRRGDLENTLLRNGLRTEPLDLRTFPYLIVSDVKNPQVDPWQHGVRAYKI